MTPREQRIFGFTVFAAFTVFVLVLPQFISDFRARDYAYVGIYLIALLGLNILTGYTGQISLGHGAFMAIGGYTTAILMAGNEQFGGPIPSGMQDIWTLPIAGLVAGLFGLAFGLPALRLSGLYLALATFAVAVAMPSTVKRFEEYTGGGEGIQLFGLPELTGSNAVASGEDFSAPATFELLGLTFTQNDWMYYLAWSIALVAFAGAWLVLRGRTGRAFRAVRDSETAAVSSGVSLARYKTLAFGVSAAYAGVAGGLFAIASAFVNPDTFPIALSIFLLVGIVVGGLGGLSGLVVGAIFVAFLPLWAQGQDLGSVLPDSVIQGDTISIPILGDFLFKGTSAPGGPAIVYGIVLILLMFVLPNGVGGLFRRIGQLITHRRYSRSK
ncbi:MAG TPA: branched-chain amino acid ABC transporter permease [Gaiellaceae bacterium]|nr:branched-chain amino acid ABC transporter permease [Gaiellaceae bacterium]